MYIAILLIYRVFLISFLTQLLNIRINFFNSKYPIVSLILSSLLILILGFDIIALVQKEFILYIIAGLSSILLGSIAIFMYIIFIKKVNIFNFDKAITIFSIIIGFVFNMIMFWCAKNFML